MAKHDWIIVPNSDGWITVRTTWEKIETLNLRSIGFTIQEAVGFLIFGPTAIQPISNVSVTFTVGTENQ